ncbi:uncharacterized protein LOC115214260 isoform X2 [Octopus sinensis]|uniref:Uncharacterized protein LOC115214260 isoform X2 n=1 Tax=Octopus sinensis TaxID=2607531 RepID=A0A7E6EZN4_9MOLL|nr:uncharacterized protein LOC115214260 isoform X2 [Octopus sinensis]
MVFITRSESKRRCSQRKSRSPEFTKLTTKKINVKSEDQEVVSKTKSHKDPGKISESVSAELVTPRTLRKKACLMMKETFNMIKTVENNNTNKSEHTCEATPSEVKCREFDKDTLIQKTRASNLANIDSLQTKETLSKKFTPRRLTRQSARFASVSTSTVFKSPLKVHMQEPMALIDDVKNVDAVLNSEAAQTENDVSTEVKSKRETNILCPEEKFQDSDITKVDNLQSDQTTPEEKDIKNQSTRKSAIKASENISSFLRSPGKMGTKRQCLNSTQVVQSDSNEAVLENKSQVVEMELKQDTETIPSVQKVQDSGETDINKLQIEDASSKEFGTPRRLTRKSVINASENIIITASVPVISPRKTRATMKSSVKARISVSSDKAGAALKSPEKASIPLKSPRKASTDLKSPGKASALVKNSGKSSALLSLEACNPVESPQEANIPVESLEVTTALVGSLEATTVLAGSSEATGAPVESLEATGAPVQSLEATGAPVQSLEATGAPVQSLEATGAPVQSLEATGAPVQSLEATGAPVQSLEATGAPVQSLEATGAPVQSLEATGAPVQSLEATGAPVQSLEATGAPVQSLEATGAPVQSLEATGAPVQSLEATGAPVQSLEATGAPVQSLEAAGAPVQSLEAAGAPVESLEAAGAPVESLEAAGAPVESLEAAGAPVESLEATGDPVESLETTCDPVESLETTSAFVENSARANTKLSKVIESLSNKKCVLVLDSEEIRNSSLGKSTENSNQFVMSQSAGEDNTSAKSISKTDISKLENREDTGNKMDQETALETIKLNLKPLQTVSFGNAEESKGVSPKNGLQVKVLKTKKRRKSFTPEVVKNDKTEYPAQDMNKPSKTKKEGKEDSKENKSLKRKLIAQDADENVSIETSSKTKKKRTSKGILFIESLPESVEASSIKTLFSENKIKLKKHKTLKPGAAIVQLKDWSEIGKAVSLLSENYLGKAICINSLKDDQCEVDHCINQSDHAPPITEKMANVVITEDEKCKLVVNNLPSDCKVEDLAKMFPVATAIKLYPAKRYAIVKNAKQAAPLSDENAQKAKVDESCMEQKVPKKKVKKSKPCEEKVCSRILYIEGYFKHFSLLQLSDFFDGKILLKKDRYIVVKFKDIKTSKKYFTQLMKLTNNNEIVTVKYLPKCK